MRRRHFLQSPLLASAAQAQAPPATRETAMPRSYKRSMFLASALERLVIAVLLSGLIWLGISWAVS